MSIAPQDLDNGLLVIFEGIDGSGKSTQAKLAHEQLAQEGWTSLTTSRNLGGTPIGEELRKVILSPLERPASTNLYISAAIQEALVEKIQAERAGGQFILMDRGPLSLAAYEIYGSGLDGARGWPVVDSGMRQLQPELTIIYMADVKASLERAHKVKPQADYFESKPQSYFEKVSEGYQAAAERYQDATIIIDADQSVEVVHEQTMQAIYRVLGQKLAV
jgi:dTMP kinase